MMFRALSLTAAAFALAIAVLGSWIRINGAGMTCPDWPLCNGQIVPPLDGGVLLEWGHRMIVFLESFVLLGALIAAWRERKRVAGVRLVVALVCATFVVQVGLGAATVALSNTPWSVVIHWGTGMAFLAALVTLAILSVLRPAPGSALRGQSALLPLLAASAVAAFAAMCAGAYVSSSGDGLACVSVPLCDGSVFGATAGQVAQMTHRFLALVFVAVATTALAAGVRADVPTRVRVATAAAYLVIVAQVVLGVLNVVWMLPTSLREAHAANAAMTFVAFVVAFVLARIDGTVATARAPQRKLAGFASKGLGSR